MKLTKFKNHILFLAISAAATPASAEIIDMEKTWRGISAVVVQKGYGDKAQAKVEAKDKALKEMLELISYHSQKITNKSEHGFESTNEIRKAAIIKIKLLTDNYTNDTYEANYQVNIVDNANHPEAIRDVESYLMLKNKNQVLLSGIEYDDTFMEAELAIIDLFQNISEKVQWVKTKGSLNLIAGKDKKLGKNKKSLAVFKVDMTEFLSILEKLKEKEPLFKKAVKISQYQGRINRNELIHIRFDKKMLNKNPRLKEFALFLARQNLVIEIKAENQLITYPLSGLGDLWTGDNSFYDYGHITYATSLCGNALKNAYPSLSGKWLNERFGDKLYTNSFVTVQHTVKPMGRHENEASFSSNASREKSLMRAIAQEVYGGVKMYRSIKLPEACKKALGMKKAKK